MVAPPIGASMKDIIDPGQCETAPRLSHNYYCTIAQAGRDAAQQASEACWKDAVGFPQPSGSY